MRVSTIDRTRHFGGFMKVRLGENRKAFLFTYLLKWGNVSLYPIYLAGFFFLLVMNVTVPVSANSTKIKSLCEINYPSDSRIEWKCRKLRWGDNPKDLFGKYWPSVLRFNRMDRRHFAGGISIKVAKRLEELEDFTPLPETYPDAAEEEKFILVDQSEMFLGAYEYGRLVLSFPVAVGIKGSRVPNGKFRIDAGFRGQYIWIPGTVYIIDIGLEMAIILQWPE